MKYLFFAHSHTVVLCSLGTIEYLHLPHEDCVFIATRNYEVPEGLTDIKIIDANALNDEYNDKPITGSRREKHEKIKTFDRQIASWTDNDSVHVFLPHIYGGIFLLFATYGKCKKVSFVQEGATIGKGFFVNHIDLYHKISWWLLSYKNYGCFRVYPCLGFYTDGILKFQKKIDVYCTSKEYFKYMPKEKTCIHYIKWPEYNEELTIEHPEAPIFIFDGYVRNGIVELDIYEKACQRLIKENNKQFNYIKFHPAQSEQERNNILNAFASLGVRAEVFSETKPFEFYIAKLKDLNLVGFSSSLLFFAKDAGHHVVAHTSWLLESPKFKEQARKGYPIFDN